MPIVEAVRNVRANSPDAPAAPPFGSGGRLNLLLSYAGWHPESWVDRLPSLLAPMGIQSLRASSGAQAQRVMTDNRIHIAVVDLGLPLDDGAYGHGGSPEFAEGGPRLLELLSRLDAPPPVVAVKRSRTSRDDCRDLAAALRLGAFAVVDRPKELSDLEVILGVLHRILERHYEGRWPVA
ncbi:MAG: response regulator [Leptolyngbya sp. PLA1]|nr:response regulator [Leptolyngbya sp. PLA1]